MAKATSEARAAIAELVSELDRTRKEYAKSTVQLTQAETQIQQMRDADVKKDQLIAHLEAEQTKKDQSHREEVHLLREEFRAKDEAWAFKVEKLEIEVRQLTEENAGMATYEKENRQLRDSLLESQAIIERLQLTNDDLKSRLVDGSHDKAAALEDSFNKRLADAEKKFRAEAYRALSEEAKLALQGSDHLQTVLRRQNDSIESVLQKCKHLEQAHAKVCQDQEATQQNLNQHLAEIQRMRKQLGDARTKNTQLEESLKQRKLERASLELLYIEYEASRKQLVKVSEKSRRAIREAERWKNRAVQLSHELTGEQLDAAEARIQPVQLRSERIETHLQRQRQRGIRRDYKKQMIAEGAASLRLTEPYDEQILQQQQQQQMMAGEFDGDGGGDWSDIEDLEVTGEDVAAEARNINPMEILSMWNKNFESWRPALDSIPADRSPRKDLQPQQLELAVHRRPSPPSHVTIVEPVARGDATPGGGGTRLIQSSIQPFTSQSAQHDEPPASADQALQQRRGAPLAPVRPQRKVDDVRCELDRHLSVLSKPKYSTLASSAKLFGSAGSGNNRTAEAGRSGATASSTGNLSFDSLSVVTHGEFQRLKKQVHEAQRFLAP